MSVSEPALYNLSAPSFFKKNPMLILFTYGDSFFLSKRNSTKYVVSMLNCKTVRLIETLTINV